jgi:16S rRNA (guanine1207-N2)-methyltransferase
MSQSRLSTALNEGFLTLPAGKIAVLRPPATTDLSGFPADRLMISHGFRPDHDHWSRQGFAVTDRGSPADAVLVIVPRSKALARALVAEACALAPMVIVDGQKTDGVDSLWREVKVRCRDVPSLTKAHGRLFAFAPPPDRFADWAMGDPVRAADGFFRQAGVFSDDGIDRGSALLAAVLPARLPGRVADLGAGWGYLASVVLGREGVAAVDLIEAERLALDCARLNVTDPRAGFHWADATTFAPARPYDAVVMNPPFHSDRAANPDLGRAFIAAAARMLTPQGHLWMVANRHLPYETALSERFRVVEDMGGDGAFKIIHATRPKR